ncbi:MAG: hypothetical protein ACFB4I_07910 [Cyanophyceae cyanobacterium]
MPKQGSRRKPQKFFCPYCQERLWRVTGSQQYLCYADSEMIQRMCQMTSQKAKTLASQGTYLDRNHWIEEFLCGQHGKLWLLFSRQDDVGTVNAIGRTIPR